MRLIWVALWLGCSAGQPAPVTPPTAPSRPPLVLDPPAAVPVPDPQPPATKIVVEASGAASRQPERARVLRELLVERQGRLQIAKGYARVGLTLTKLVDGTLDDPGYPARPVGTNHLPVVLLDEAAFATADGLGGFEGTWSLSRTATGTLYVSSIRDTPWPAHKVAGRPRMIERTRAGLRSTSPDDRVAALATLEHHGFLELVPDAIALLDDARSDHAQPQPPPRGGGPVVVHERALLVLRELVRPFADDRTPGTADRATWNRFWQTLLTPEPPRHTIASTPVTLATIPMNQSWPGLVGVDDRFVFAIGRMEAPFDGHTEGVALTTPPFDTRTWISAKPGEALGAARGSDGATAVLIARDDRWQLHLVSPQGGTSTVSLGFAASHAAIAPAATGYAIAYFAGETDQLFVLALDASGKPRGPPRAIQLSGRAAGGYHRGIFPLQLARKPGGFLVTLDTDRGVYVLALDEKLAPGLLRKVHDVEAGIPQPAIGVSGDRAMIAWAHDRHAGASKLAWAIVDLAGRPIAPLAFAGFDVDAVSRPIALEDGGWAVAWIESEQEVHLGRWNAKGEPVGMALVERTGAILFAITLAKQGKELLVGYQDVARYPYTLVARRVDPAGL